MGEVIAFSAPIRRAIYTTNAVESSSNFRTRRGQEADLPGLAGRGGEVEAAAAVLVAGEGRICHPLRRAGYSCIQVFY